MHPNASLVAFTPLLTERISISGSRISIPTGRDSLQRSTTRDNSTAGAEHPQLPGDMMQGNATKEETGWDSDAPYTQRMRQALQKNHFKHFWGCISNPFWPQSYLRWLFTSYLLWFHEKKDRQQKACLSGWKLSSVPPLNQITVAVGTSWLVSAAKLLPLFPDYILTPVQPGRSKVHLRQALAKQY